MAEDEADGKRLADLERRWRQEPGSRVFLQLAEEYRRTGRTGEALEVLEQGLEKNPRHVAAQVARSRCLLELGRTGEAVQVLETVIDQDPTHLVARKLLVEAHIRWGNAPAARRQLDLYSSFAGADPEVDEFRERIQDLLLIDADREPAVPAPGARPHAAQESAVAEPAAPPAERLETAAAGAEPPGEESAPAPEAEPEAGGGASRPAPAGERRLSPLPAREPFPGLEEALRRHAANGSGDVFPRGPVRSAPPSAAFRERREEDWEASPEESAAGREAAALLLAEEEARPALPAGLSRPASATAVDEDDTLPLGFAAEPAAATPGAGVTGGEGAVAARLQEEPPATVTLGQLYLRQGHPAEAERIFRRVLERDASNRAAREGLESIASRPPRNAAPANLVERKVQLLERYLTLLRRGAERDVP